MERSVAYTLRFAAIVGVMASLLVATVAVALNSRQEANRLLDRRRTVLEVAGLSAPGERLPREEIGRRFQESIRLVVVELETGAPVMDVDAATFDQESGALDFERRRPAPENTVGVSRLPDHELIYHLVRDGTVESLVFPFEGAGLWSTMFGFVALSPDLSTVQGITFYEHAETAGLGAQISDPAWRALWVGRRFFDDDWTPRLSVTKGRVGSPRESPFAVDGIAGATLTGNGVTAALHFWLGDAGFGPYLDRYRRERGIT